ncbi:MAG: hypothetical protein QXY65_02950 [Candidatus Methanomethylicaceae archaeon]
MCPKRRRSFHRSPILRTKLWDAKMSGDIYATQLPVVKKLALDKVANYQVIQENLISIVKDIVNKYGVEYAKTQEYMWYAEKLWKFTQTYKGNALQNQSDALYLWYLARGLNDAILRSIALALGIKLNSLEYILESTMVPALVKIVKKDTLLANGTEQTLLEYSGIVSSISGYIDLSNMTSEDTVIIKMYVKIKEDGEWRLYRSETFIGEQIEKALYIMPRLSGLMMKVTLQQTTGVYKSYDYLFVKGM